MTPDNAIWWFRLKAKQKQTQKYEGPIYQGGTLPVTDITAEPIGKGKYLAEFDKRYPRQEYKETNEYIRRFQPEKVVQKQAWRDVERNRFRDNYAESYMIRDRDLKMQQEYEKNKQNLPWWKKRVEGVNTTPQQKEQILEQQAKGRLDWSNKPLEHKAGWIASETAMALVPELFFLKGTGKGAQIAKKLSNTASDIPTSSIINKTDYVVRPIASKVDDVGKGFKSEINWAKWNPEIPTNKPLMQEYHAIEQAAKRNGTWMKNPDGTDFPGTPEQFVQQNSSNFKNAFGNTKVLVNERPQILTHNSPDTFSEFSLDKVNNGRLSGDGVYTFEEGALWKGMPEHLKKAFRYPAKLDQPKYGNIEYHLYGNSANPKIGKGQFDDITKYIAVDNPTSTRVVDDINRKTIHVFPSPNQLKSAIGNNGMFDMTNPNIYKGLISPALMTGYLKSKTNKDEKGKR